jgi:hypothetical protein
MDILKSAIQLLSSRDEEPKPKNGKFKFTPVNLRSYNKNIDTSAKSDNTKVVPQKLMTEKQSQNLQAKKNAAELARRKQNIETSYQSRNKPFSAQQLAEETGAIGDKLRLFPNDPNSFIDEYLNPAVMIGDMASGLGSIPLNIKNKDYGKVAMALGIPLATGALAGLGGAKTRGQFLNEVLNPVVGLSDPVKGLLKKSNVNAQELINYLKKGEGFRKNVLRTPEMGEVTAAYREDIAKLLSEEGQKRLKKIGIDVEDFNKNLPELFFQNERGSYAIGTHPSVTERPGIYINPETNKEVMKKYDMTQGDILSHEIGHTLQTAVDKNTPEFKKRMDFYKQHVKDIKEYPNWGWWKKMIYDEPYPIDRYEHLAVASPRETLIDVAAGNLIPKENLSEAAIGNLAYFNKGQGATLEGLLSGNKDIRERLPFLREMRSSMKSKGYIDNIYDEIPESTISKYLEENPNNRISSAFENNQENRKLLAKLFKVLPAAGAGVATTLSLADKKNDK